MEATISVLHEDAFFNTHPVEVEIDRPEEIDAVFDKVLIIEKHRILIKHSMHYNCVVSVTDII